MRSRTLLLSTLLALGAAVPGQHLAAAAADPSDSCAGGATLLEGYAGPASLLLQVEQVGGTTLVCVAVDDGSGVHAGGLLQLIPPAGVSFQPDPPGTDQPPVASPPPVPSGTCQAQAGSTRVLDMQLPAGERAWIYLAPDGGLEDLCAGVGGPVIAFGGRVSSGGVVQDSPGTNESAAWTPDGA